MVSLATVVVPPAITLQAFVLTFGVVVCASNHHLASPAISFFNKALRFLPSIYSQNRCA